MLLILGFAFWTYTVVRSDFRVQLKRTVPSYESETSLGEELFNLADWPVFVRGLKRAVVRAEDGSELREQKLTVGATLRLEIEPPGKEWKRFTVDFLILEIDPNKSFRLRFTKDSSGKMDQLFSELEWTLRIEPALMGQKEKNILSGVFGELTGVTYSKRSRFFGTLSEKILLNQIFFFDLIKLASVSHQKELKAQNLAPSYP